MGKKHKKAKLPKEVLGVKLPKEVRDASKDESHAILGPPEACLEQIRTYAAAGATHLSLRLVNPRTAARQIGNLHQDILPRL